MKYLIVSLIKGSAGEFIDSLQQEVANKFDVVGGIKRKCPPHITLKYNVVTDKITELENVIKKFCDSNKKIRYQLEGFDYFDKKVIFVKVKETEEMRESHNKFVQELKNISWMTWKKEDKKIHFHASIAHSDIKDNLILFGIM